MHLNKHRSEAMNILMNKESIIRGVGDLKDYCNMIS